MQTVTIMTADMVYTILLCKIMGLVLTIMMLGLLCNRKHFQAMAESLVRTPAMHFAATIVPLVLGSILIVTHNNWAGGYYTVLVSLVSWLIFISGLVRALLPDMWIGMVQKNHKSAMIYVVFAILLIIGLILLYGGFFG
jgi:hypothetical protein